MSKNIDKLPINHKCNLTIDEAAEYSNIGQNKISELLKIPNCTFVLYVGKKKLNGHKMSVYVEGDGDKTIVFMSGGGTCSPILDFKSLYSTLTDNYKIVVVGKFGYGFSDVVDKERNIDSILEDTRTALAKADIEGLYVLCPHSMSGIEALYWAQQYPEEVEAIIGLDMAIPKAYEDYRINMSMLKISQFAARIGITRILPSISESDAIKYGTLTDTEKEIYRARFYEKTATTTMLNEVKCIKENAEIVQIMECHKFLCLCLFQMELEQDGMKMSGVSIKTVI